MSNVPLMPRANGRPGKHPHGLELRAMEAADHIGSLVQLAVQGEGNHGAINSFPRRRRY